MPQLDQSAKSLSAIDRGVQHFVVVVGEPIHARLDIGRDPRAFTCDVGTSLVVGDTVADKLPNRAYASTRRRGRTTEGVCRGVGGCRVSSACASIGNVASKFVSAFALSIKYPGSALFKR